MEKWVAFHSVHASVDQISVLNRVGNRHGCRPDPGERIKHAKVAGAFKTALFEYPNKEAIRVCLFQMEPTVHGGASIAVGYYKRGVVGAPMN
jgi:hypothetical protein